MNMLCSMQNKKIHVCRCISTRSPFDWAIEIFQTEPCYSPPQTRTDCKIPEEDFGNEIVKTSPSMGNCKWPSHNCSQFSNQLVQKMKCLD